MDYRPRTSMTRIFLTMASLNALALLASFGLGVVCIQTEVTAPAPEQPLSGSPWFLAHLVASLCTAIFTLLVHCLIFTYFLGTGRWVKEVARAYDLPDALWPRQTREFKRQAFPPALWAMLATIATVASGAGVQTQTWPWWTHSLLAVSTLFLNGWAFYVEYQTVTVNGRVMDEVMAAVQQIRSGESGVPQP